MEEQYKEFVGVDSLYAALITTDTEETYTAGTPEYLAPTAEIVGEPETEVTPSYYDNVQMDSYVSEGATVLTLTISGISAEKAAKYLGKHYDATTGRVFDDGDPNPPDCALSFRFNKGKTGYRYYQYLKGKFTGGTEEATSKTNTVDVKTYQMTFTAVKTIHMWDIGGKKMSLKRIFGDTSEETFIETGWFTAVQVTPVTP